MFEGPSFNSQSNELAIESVELAHDGIEVQVIISKAWAQMGVEWNSWKRKTMGNLFERMNRRTRLSRGIAGSKKTDSRYDRFVRTDMDSYVLWLP